MRPPLPARAGAVLILIAGIVALLASLAFAFILRMRGDGEEIRAAMRETQARIMLMAACNYVLEAGRIGWDVPGTPEREEAFGWIDVRDGSPGPSRTTANGAPDPVWKATSVEDSDGNGSADRPAWPAVGSVARCPMHTLERPPFAVSLTATYNPINPTSGTADFGRPYLRYPDPRPAVDNGWSDWTDLGQAGAVTAANFQKWARGDQRVRQNSDNLAWFRVYRDGPATFVVTCGAGATRGFRDWDEVRGADAEALFYFDEKNFVQALEAEARLWYRIQWSAAVQELSYHLLDHEFARDFDHYSTWPMNASHTWPHSVRTQTHQKNQAGTIQWVQRLPVPPLDGKW